MSREAEMKAISGWAMLAFELLLVAPVIGLTFYQLILAGDHPPGWLVARLIALLILASLTAAGFMIVEPNGSKVLSSLAATAAR